MSRLRNEKGPALHPFQHSILASKNSRSAAISYAEEHGTISGVPTEKRELAKMVFDEWVKELPTTSRGINALLSTYGVRGAGKTVQQAFNMLWFVQREKIKDRKGFAVEVTFNDDYYSLCHETEEYDVTKSTVRVILLRVVEALAGAHYSKGPVTPVMTACYNTDFSKWANFTISDALALARRALQLPPETPVLLAIDEIAKLHKISTKISEEEKKQKVPKTESLRKKEATVAALSKVCRIMDDTCVKGTRTTWVCATTYGVDTLQKFMTDSGRPVAVQPLPPIFPISVESTQFRHLPPILQILQNNEDIDFSPTKKTVLHTISMLMMETGGHPRRVEALFHSLSDLPNHLKEKSSQIKEIPGKSDKDLLKWVMNQTDYHKELKRVLLGTFVTEAIALMQRPFSFVGNFDLEDLEHPQTSVDMIHPFEFPDSDKKLEKHVASNAMVEAGVASYLADPPPQCRIFLPFPILKKWSSLKKSSSLAWSVVNYIEAAGKPGRFKGIHLESVMFETMKFYATHQPKTSFLLRDVCRLTGQSSDGLSVFDFKLKPFRLAESVPHVEILPYSIDKKQNDHLITFGDASMFTSLPAGMYKPASEGNSADLIGIFDVCDGPYERLVVDFQCKDYYNIKPEMHPVGKWRWSRQGLTHDVLPVRRNNFTGVVGMDDPNFFKFKEQLKECQKEKEGKKRVAFAFILITSNPIPMDGHHFGEIQHDPTTPPDLRGATLSANEALMDLIHMRNWIPTVAYNVQTANRLRSLYAADSEETIADE
jgi:hypothetical protein